MAAPLLLFSIVIWAMPGKLSDSFTKRNKIFVNPPQPATTEVGEEAVNGIVTVFNARGIEVLRTKTTSSKVEPDMKNAWPGVYLVRTGDNRTLKIVKD